MTLPRLSDIPIRTKLVLLLLVLVLFPFLLYTTLLVDQVSREMERVGLRTADLVLDQSALFVESRVELVKRALDLLTLDPTVRELAAADPMPYDTDVGLWIRDAARLHQVENILSQNNPDIRSFVLYTVGGLGASLSRHESREFKALADQAGTLWYRILEAHETPSVWFAPGVAFDDAVPGDLHALRRIPDDLNLQATNGWARADVRARAFVEILEKAQFSPRTAVFLVDSRGDLVAASSSAADLDPPELSALSEASGPWPLVRAGLGEYQVGQRSLSLSGWRLVMAIPRQDITAVGGQIRSLLLVLLALILPLMVPLAFWAARSSTRRLELLMAGVRRLGEGGFDVELPENGRDEFGELTRNFNLMVGRIRTLVEDQYRLGAEVKNLELQALQAQINPHFLYNTLDLINGLALGAGQSRIAETTLALSKFYRLSLSGGSETLPLAKEFDHAVTYVRIQNLRFESAFELTVDRDPRWDDVPLLKMILQPLVENAILHGILEKPEERGRIILRARTQEGPGGEELVLEVEDDGVGMEPAVVAGLLSSEARPRGIGDHGYGVFNIDRRLRLRYGEAAGLAFESIPGNGTVVRIRIPSQALSTAIR